MLLEILKKDITSDTLGEMKKEKETKERQCSYFFFVVTAFHLQGVVRMHLITVTIASSVMFVCYSRMRGIRVWRCRMPWRWHHFWWREEIMMRRELKQVAELLAVLG